MLVMLIYADQITQQWSANAAGTNFNKVTTNKKPHVQILKIVSGIIVVSKQQGTVTSLLCNLCKWGIKLG